MKNVLKDLRVLEHEEKAVLINQESKSWIKINKSLYEKYIDKELDENNMLLKIVNKYMFDYENNNDSQLSINTVYFTVTRKCNLACEFCSMRSNPYVDTSENMSLDTIKEKVIPVLKLIDINRIVITGGEPVTRKDLIQLIDLINEELDVGITFQTNGLLLDENIIKSLQGKINQIDISIENIFDDSDLFNKMINIFDLIKKYDHKLFFSFVIDKENKKHLFKALDLIYKYNANVSLKFISNIGFALDNLIKSFTSDEMVNIYYNIANYIIEKEYYTENLINIFGIPLDIKDSCSAKGKCLSIYPNGDMYMCHSLNTGEFSLGNIQETDYQKLMENINIKINDNKIKERLEVDYIEECKNCEVKYLCQGPCAAERYWSKKSSFNTCKLLLILFKYNLFIFNQELSIRENMLAIREYFRMKIEE